MYAECIHLLACLTPHHKTRQVKNLSQQTWMPLLLLLLDPIHCLTCISSRHLGHIAAKHVPHGLSLPLGARDRLSCGQ